MHADIIAVTHLHIQNVHCMLHCNTKLIEYLIHQLLRFIDIVIVCFPAFMWPRCRINIMMQLLQATVYLAVLDCVLSFGISRNQFPYRCDNDQLLVRCAFVHDRVHDIFVIIR